MVTHDSKGRLGAEAPPQQGGASRRVGSEPPASRASAVVAIGLVALGLAGAAADLVGSSTALRAIVSVHLSPLPGGPRGGRNRAGGVQRPFFCV